MLKFSRSFSSTRAARIDLAGLYSRVSRWRSKEPAHAVVDPTKEATPKGEIAEDGLPQDLRIVGLPRKLEEDWPSVKQYAEFVAYPTNHFKHDLKQTDIDASLQKVTESEISSLMTRLDAIKKVSTELNIAVPDHALAKISSLAEFRQYLVGASKLYDEKRPDAVYFNPEEFSDLNITFHEDLKERIELKLRMQELNKEAVEKAKEATSSLLE